jgi:hypothetical protein
MLNGRLVVLLLLASYLLAAVVSPALVHVHVHELKAGGSGDHFPLVDHEHSVLLGQLFVLHHDHETPPDHEHEHGDGDAKPTRTIRKSEMTRFQVAPPSLSFILPSLAAPTPIRPAAPQLGPRPACPVARTVELLL